MDIYAANSQEVLERISRHCPEALSAYLQCINRADKNQNIIFSRKMVDEEMSLGWTKFQNLIKKLALENLLEWHTIKGGMSVTMAKIDENV